MRFRVRFQYNEETGEVEVFRVEAVGDGARASDHDAVHDRVAGEIANVVERGAGIVEDVPQPVVGPGTARQGAQDETRTATPETPATLGGEEAGG